MKIAVAAALSVFLLLLGNEIYSFSKKNADSEARYRKTSAELAQARAELDNMRSDLDYYLNPANLEKEMKARFNYRQPDERMLILVPATSSTKQ